VTARIAARLGRMRQTGSLCLRRRAWLRTMIASTQETPFGPWVTPQASELSKPEDDQLASSQAEYEDGARFFEHFDGELTEADLDRADVLDLGCGFGGRTVYYAERGPREVTGLDISERVVERCRNFAQGRGVDNARFLVGFAEELPFPDESFDHVLGQDVIEHVHDPVLALREIRRVLRPGGHAWLIFPTYLGAGSSHLAYVTQIPALHRLFDPDVIVEVVNEFLAADPERYIQELQPPPKLDPLGRRPLPSMNGMDRRQAVSIIERCGFVVQRGDIRLLSEANQRTPFRQLGMVADAVGSLGWTPELLIGRLRFHLIAS